MIHSLLFKFIIDSLWDLDTEKECVRTCIVNRARRFLHSNGSIDDSPLETENLAKNHQRQVSVSSQDLEWGTPPSSPAESILSMATCEEGIIAYIAGSIPTQEDRHIFEALEHLSGMKLAKYPAVKWYLTHLNSFTSSERMAWKNVNQVQSGINTVVAKKLDLDLTY